jgi:hypothetical protein
MDKYFDRIAIISEGRIAGITRKPRELYVPTTGSVTDMGVPVFARTGEVVGIVVTQLPDAEENAADRMSMMSRMSGMGGMSTMILPVSEAAKATKRALETAKSDAGKEEAAATKPAATRPAKSAATANKIKAKSGKNENVEDASKGNK